MPLSFDMPYEELLTYQGTNPRPADFDQYWDKSLAEMHATDPAPELVPADFQTSFADCFDLYYTGLGGARIHAKLLRPKAADAAAPGGADVPRLFRQRGRLDGQTGLRGAGLYGRRDGLSRARRAVGGQGRRAGLDAARAYRARVWATSRKICSIARSSWTRRNWRGSSWRCRTWTPRASARRAAARAAG